MPSVILSAGIILSLLLRRQRVVGPVNPVRRALLPAPISIGLFRGKIAIVRRTKRCYSGIANAIKGCLLLADVVLVELPENLRSCVNSGFFWNVSYRIKLRFEMNRIGTTCGIVHCNIIIPNMRYYLLQSVIFIHCILYIRCRARKIIIFFEQHYPIKHIVQYRSCNQWLQIFKYSTEKAGMKHVHRVRADSLSRS